MSIKHIVLFKFKNEVTQAQIEECRNLLAALQKKIPGIESFSWATYSSDENLNRGYTHGFVMVFSNKERRDNYLINDFHEEVKRKISSLLADDNGVIAFDYVENDESPQAICQKIALGLKRLDELPYDRRLFLESAKSCLENLYKKTASEKLTAEINLDFLGTEFIGKTFLTTTEDTLANIQELVNKIDTYLPKKAALQFTL